MLFRSKPRPWRGQCSSVQLSGATQRRMRVSLLSLGSAQGFFDRGPGLVCLFESQWEILFNNFNVLTVEERVDYLYIKFIAHGFLNLEKEKELLDLFRSNILRCFQSVKDEFLKNGTTDRKSVV